MSVTLLPTHPYVKNFKAHITDWGGGKARVKWRQFDSQKVDEIFDTRAEAETFAKILKESCHLLEDYDVEDFAEHSKFWYEVYK